jgi:hypothetical protein
LIIKTVSAVHEINPFSRSLIDSLVHRVVNPLVGFANPISNILFIFFDNINGIVGGAAVDNYVLDVFIRLADDAEHGLLQSGGAVVNYGDDGY